MSASFNEKNIRKPKHTALCRFEIVEMHRSMEGIKTEKRFSFDLIK